MALTQREREIVELLRAEPLLDAAGLADRVGSNKAAVAVHLSNLTRKGVIVGRGYVLRPDEGSVVVVGGTNMDIKAQSRAALALRTSNPGETTSTPGGVGRNIAENLARLGSPTQLVSPVGRDAFGDQVLDATRAAGVGLDHVIRGEEPTGTYLAVLDAGGELVVAVSTMGATDGLTVDQLTGVRDLVANADLLVVDGNIPAAPTTWLLDTAATADVPVVIDPVSVAKARPLATILSPDRPVLALTPNLDELGHRRRGGAGHQGRHRPRRRRPPRARRRPRLGAARRARQRPQQPPRGRRPARGARPSRAANHPRRRHRRGRCDDRRLRPRPPARRQPARRRALRPDRRGPHRGLPPDRPPRPHRPPRRRRAASHRCRASRRQTHHQEKQMTPHPALKLNDEVATALREGRPVVALESTIISHGMPYPRNVEMAI